MSSETAFDIDQVHRLSTDEYHRLIEAGGFDEDARVELIDGLLADLSPKTREHENAVVGLRTGSWTLSIAAATTYASGVR